MDRRIVSLPALVLVVLSIAAVPTMYAQGATEGWQYDITLEPFYATMVGVISVTLYKGNIIVVSENPDIWGTGISIYAYGRVFNFDDANVRHQYPVYAAVNDSGVYMYAMFGYNPDTHRFNYLRLIHIKPSGTMEILDVMDATQIGVVLGTVYVNGKLIAFYSNIPDARLYAVFEDGSIKPMDITYSSAVYVDSVVAYNSTHIFISKGSNLCVYDDNLNQLACKDVGNTIRGIQVFDDQISVRTSTSVVVLDLNLNEVARYPYYAICGRLIDGRFVSVIRTAYTYRMLITVNNSGIALPDYEPLACTVTRGSYDIYAVVRDQGGSVYIANITLNPAQPAGATVTETATVTNTKTATVTKTVVQPLPVTEYQTVTTTVRAVVITTETGVMIVLFMLLLLSLGIVLYYLMKR